MKQFAVGATMREHADDATASPLGVVVWIEGGVVAGDESARKTQRFWYIAYPLEHPISQKTTKRTASYIKAPIAASVAETLSRHEEGKISFAMSEPESERLLQEEQLARNASREGLARRTRQTSSKWLAKRNSLFALIKPILKKHTIGQMLEGGRAEKAFEKRRLDLGHAESRIVEQAWRRYYLYGQNENAVLPAYWRCGGRGKDKHSQVQTGRPTEQPRYVLAEADRLLLRVGWKKYKVKGTTDYDAYIATMSDYYPRSITWQSPSDCQVVLLPVHERPTLSQFRFHGPKGSRKLQSWRINLGEQEFARKSRGLTGTFRDGLVAVGQVGVLDATSEDQRVVSSASRLKLLPTSWRTLTVDGYTGYILGLYRGFERGGTLAGLLSLLNCAEDHVAFCAAHGKSIKARDWYSIVPKRVRGDNGDLKSEAGIASLTTAQICLEMTKSYAAELKHVETIHKVLHRSADHKMQGSTRGKPLSRGERVPESVVKMEEGWVPVIEAILKHNNEVLVPHLLTLEMREAGVKPTRQCIVEYCLENGYVASEPANLASMRAQCLPILKGTVMADGVHVLDPTSDGKLKRYIPEMVYWSQWLHDGGHTERGRVTPIDVLIHVHPTALGEAYINVDGLKSLALKHHDPQRASLTLADWIEISKDDSRSKYLSRAQNESADASRAMTTKAINETAVEEKRREQAKTGKKGARSADVATKRQNLKEEKAARQLTSLGLAPMPAVNDAQTEAQSHQPKAAGPVLTLVKGERNAASDKMDALRALLK